MKRKLAAVLVLGASLVFTSAHLTAHHSFSAEYDSNQPITLKGKVTRLEWQNPHVYYYVDVAGDAGKVTNWAVEIGAPNGLYRQGWRRDSLKPGDVVTVQGFRAKNGKAHINGRSVVLQDGKKVFSGANDDGGPGAR